MRINKLLNQTVKVISKHSPELLAAFGIANIVMAVVSAVRDTSEALPELYSKQEENEDNEITVTEVIKTAAPYYGRTITHTALAIGSVALGAKISYSQKSALATSLAATKLISSEYSKQVKALNPDVDRQAKINAANRGIDDHEYRTGEITFIDAFTGKRFTATMNDVNEAEYEMNRLLQLKGIVSLNDFYRFIGLEADPTIDERFGWCSDAEAFYGYKWIDFKHKFVKDPKNKSKEVCKIFYPFEPHDDYSSIHFAGTGDQLPFNT